MKKFVIGATVVLAVGLTAGVATAESKESRAMKAWLDDGNRAVLTAYVAEREGLRSAATNPPEKTCEAAKRSGEALSRLTPSPDPIVNEMMSTSATDLDAAHVECYTGLIGIMAGGLMPFADFDEIDSAAEASAQRFGNLLIPALEMQQDATDRIAAIIGEPVLAENS
jgi:hypothetical protein